MKKILPLIAFSMAVLSSCTVTQEYATSRTKEITGTAIVQIPKLAKLDINTSSRATGTSELKARRGKYPQIVEAAQKIALMNAIKQSGADVLVEPTYHVVHKLGYHKESVKCEVSGFKATYTELRDITPQDTSLLKTILLLR